MFTTQQHVHFIGIGGIGMSGIAEILLSMGMKVSGSDLRRGPVTDRLAKMGATIFEGHDAGNIAGATVVVTSSAVSATNPEVLEARALKALDPFRAPPTETEIARRRPERLTPRQRDYLTAYGYPYVLEEFRLHFTLSGAVREPERLAEKLAADFAREVLDPKLSVDALVLFEQSPGGDFRIRKRCGFGCPL